MILHKYPLIKDLADPDLAIIAIWLFVSFVIKSLRYSEIVKSLHWFFFIIKLMNTYFIDISVNIDNKSTFITLKTETKYPINSYETMSIRYLIKEIFVKLVFFVLFYDIFTIILFTVFIQWIISLIFLNDLFFLINKKIYFTKLLNFLWFSLDKYILDIFICT